MRTLDDKELEIVAGGVDMTTYTSSGAIDTILDTIRGLFAGSEQKTTTAVGNGSYTIRG
ncbi:MAG: hypothetical protein KIS74_03855 [Burkholderiales bacterium]|nr:hypothetical protein [Burkholderiales bacterium]